MSGPDRCVASVPCRQVGYFYHLELDSRHVGAVLVTDLIGVPVEFKYTEPVTATKLHQILYGASLERYIHETVIRERLSREVRSEPEFFIAPFEEREYLGAIAGKEMIGIQAVPALSAEMSGSIIQTREKEAFVQLEKGPPLRVFFSTANDGIQRRTVTWLQEISRSMDILEPLDRVAKALRMLCGEAKQTTPYP